MLVNCEILKKTKAKMKCSNFKKKNKLPLVCIYRHYAFGNILFVFGNILIEKKEYYQKQMHFYVVKLWIHHAMVNENSLYHTLLGNTYRRQTDKDVNQFPAEINTGW